MSISPVAQRPVTPAGSSCYPDDLLQEAQHALSALADFELRFATARDRLHAFETPHAELHRSLIDLEKRYRTERAALLQRLAKAERGMKAATIGR